jgi:hypothetical protein
MAYWHALNITCPKHVSLKGEFFCNDAQDTTLVSEEIKMFKVFNFTCPTYIIPKVSRTSNKLIIPWQGTH